MQKEYISFKDTGYFSKLMSDYLDDKNELDSFFNRFPKLENFKAQIEEKQNFFSKERRQILSNACLLQYDEFSISKSTKHNIEALKETNTFTITTGHQLNLFTGPLYFLYKIVSTINLTKQLKKAYPNYNFVPIYWMATEDHDFEEINYFNFKGKKIQWNIETQGAVGTLSTKGLENVFEVFSKELSIGLNANMLKDLFRKAYVNHNNLADSTRYLANELFSSYGLVILDANNSILKREFVPIMQNELLSNTSFKAVSKTNANLQALNYKIQVNPRELNLFYLNDDFRARIVFENNSYKVVNSKISWTKDELVNHLQEFPERFSPNVIMRPLYQEVILPNLCYIGGGGELAYWLQLKAYFEDVSVPFPILLLRNSAVIISEDQHKKLRGLNISIQDLFLKQNELIETKTKELSEINVDFSAQKKHLQKQFEGLYEIAKQTDKSFIGAVGAQERKQIKGLEHLEKRLLKAQKRKFAKQLESIKIQQNELFPNQSLQERNLNFSELYLEYGNQLIPQLIESLEPLKGEFTCITL